MKLNFLEYHMFIFTASWVAQDAFQAPYRDKLYYSLFLTLAFAFMNNAHGRFFNYIKKLRKRHADHA